jgi:hypothetical protein
VRRHRVELHKLARTNEAPALPPVVVHLQVIQARAAHLDGLALRERRVHLCSRPRRAAQHRPVVHDERHLRSAFLKEK